AASRRGPGGRMLPPGALRPLVQDVELDAAIALASGRGGVVRDRLAFAVAARDEPAAIDALRDEELQNRARTLLRQPLVVLVRATAVRVPGDLRTEIRLTLQRFCNAPQRRRSFRRELRRVELEG